MVRSRILSNSAKQASMNAYQQLWQQQQFARGPLVAAMPEYWHSVCNKMGGAMPRMAVIAPPEVSSRKLSRLRRQLMRSPRETAPIQSFIPNYGLQFQRGHPSAGNASCPSRSASKVALLTPGCILAACQNQCYDGVPAVGVASTPQQPHLHLNQGHLFHYPGAASALHWQQQQHQVQQQHKQLLLQQQPKPAPVGILKNSPRAGAGQQFKGDCHTVSPPKTKKVTIRNTSDTPSSYRKPIVEQIKLKPVVPPKPNKRSKLNTLRKERQQLQHLQLQHELLKQRESMQNQKEQLKQVHQSSLQHQNDSRKQPQNQKTHLEPNTCESFNFGKLADRFMKGFSCDSDTETPMFAAANAEIKPINQGNDKPYSKNFSYEGTELKAKPEKLELPSSPGLFDRFSKRLELENDSSTITLTTEQNQSKPPYQSRTSLSDKATNTGPDPLKNYLKPGPQKATSTTSATSKGSRKMNINELLRKEKIKGLDDNPMWHSLMQLVAHMCEAKEHEKGDREQKSRLRAGSGTDGLQKQYSVYLMVTSDEEDDEDDDDDSKLTKTNGEQKGSAPKLGSHQGIHGGNEYVERCSNVYQAEHPRLVRRKRTRKRLNPRLRELAIPYPSTQTQLPMRRPLHWPKPDYSKPPGRSSRTRNPTRSHARSHSAAKPLVGKRSQRSLRATLDEKRSWRLWQDLPMTAKALNKAYSRMLSLSGANRTSAEI